MNICSLVQLIEQVFYPLPILPRLLVYMEPGTTRQSFTTNVPCFRRRLSNNFSHIQPSNLPPALRQMSLVLSQCRSDLFRWASLSTHGDYNNTLLYIAYTILSLNGLQTARYYFFQRTFTFLSDCIPSATWFIKPRNFFCSKIYTRYIDISF